MTIGLTGKKGAGKTEAAKYLASKGFVRLNFKDALIGEIISNFKPLLDDFCVHHNTDIAGLFQTKPMMMRHLMQCYGTEVRRGDDPQYWVNQYEKVLDATVDTVTDDVRFKNEAGAVWRAGGKVIRIVRKGQESTDTHISEKEMDEIEPDITIEVPDGDLETMYRKLDLVLGGYSLNYL